jgi:histone H3/H4
VERIFFDDSNTDSDEEEEEIEETGVTSSGRQGKQAEQGKQAGGKKLPTRTGNKTSVGKTLSKALKGKQLSAAQQKKIKAAARKKADKKDAANKRKHKRKNDAQPTKKKTRYKNGDRALMEIRKYQKDTELLIAKRPFSKLVVREITEKVIRDNAGTCSVCWQATALIAIHTASKDDMVKVFEAAQLNAIHGKRQTIMPKDMQLSK